MDNLPKREYEVSAKELIRVSVPNSSHFPLNLRNFSKRFVG